MRSHRRRRRHHRALIAGLIALVIVAGIVGGGAVVYAALKGQAEQLQAQLTTHLQIAQSELEAARGGLKQANASRDVNLIAPAKVHFAAAKAQFVTAAQIADTSRLIGRLEALPGFGDVAHSRHVAIDGIAEMGAAICNAGLDLADLDGELIKPPPTGGPQGRTLLTVLDQTRGGLVTVRGELDRAQKAAARVDVHVLPTGQQATFLKARDTISAALTGLDEFERLVPILKEVLGGNGARTYLVEQVNPAELRAGGGFIGTYSLLKADNGVLEVTASGNAYDLAASRASVGQSGYVVPPGPFREFLPEVGWSFVDSNFFPDFPSNARAAESFAQPALRTSIDGVLSMDYYAVARMLELTGPLAVPGYPITVDAGNFIPQLIQHDLAVDAVHKAILGAIAGPLMDRVSSLPPDRWPALLSALNGLVTERHLQAYFNRDTVENGIARFGWSGDLNATAAADYMMEVESNLGGTKANYFVTRHFTVVLSRNGGALHHRVTVDLVNNMVHFNPYGEGYRSYTELYIGDKASAATDNLTPVKYPSPDPPSGTRLLDGWIAVPGYGGTGQAVFEYDTPWHVDDRGYVEIYWQKQPGTGDDKVDLKWNDGAGHTHSVSGDLIHDVVIRLTPGGVTLTAGRPAKAVLPSLSLG